MPQRPFFNSGFQMPHTCAIRLTKMPHKPFSGNGYQMLWTHIFWKWFSNHRDQFLALVWDQFVHISLSCLLFNCCSHYHFMVSMIINSFDHKLVDCMLVMFMFITHHYKTNTPPNSLRNLNVGPRVKQW